MPELISARKLKTVLRKVDEALQGKRKASTNTMNALRYMMVAAPEALVAMERAIRTSLLKIEELQEKARTYEHLTKQQINDLLLKDRAATLTEAHLHQAQDELSEAQSYATGLEEQIERDRCQIKELTDKLTAKMLSPTSKIWTIKGYIQELERQITNQKGLILELQSQLRFLRDDPNEFPVSITRLDGEPGSKDQHNKVTYIREDAKVETKPCTPIEELFNQLCKKITNPAPKTPMPSLTLKEGNGPTYLYDGFEVGFLTLPIGEVYTNRDKSQHPLDRPNICISRNTLTLIVAWDGKHPSLWDVSKKGFIVVDPIRPPEVM